MHLVRAQDEEEEAESTTVPMLTTTEELDEKLVPITSAVLENQLKNGSDGNVSQITVNGSSKQRIIIALAVLCAALTVLLGFFVSIVVCRWIQQEKEGDSFSAGSNRPRPDLAGSSYNYRDHAYQQTVKLWRTVCVDLAALNRFLIR